jgi:hypothetical protein
VQYSAAVCPLLPLGGDGAAAPMKRQPWSRGSALSIADTRWHWFAQLRVPNLNCALTSLTEIFSMIG